jgi:hypothetical protein
MSFNKLLRDECFHNLVQFKIRNYFSIHHFLRNRERNYVHDAFGYTLIYFQLANIVLTYSHAHLFADVNLLLGAGLAQAV